MSTLCVIILLGWVVAGLPLDKPARSPEQIRSIPAAAEMDLSGLWRCSIGDEKTRLLPGTYDQTWALATLPDLHDSEGEPVFVEDKIIVCRTALYLEKLEEQATMALHLGPLMGAVEIYLNGHIVDSRGILGPEFRPSYLPLHSMHLLPAALWKSGANNVLALRMKRPTENLPAFEKPLQLGPASKVQTRLWRANLAVVILPGAIGLLLLLLGMVQLCVWVLAHRQPLLLHLGIAGVLLGTILGLRLLLLVEPGWASWTIQKLEAIALIASLLFVLFYLEEAFHRPAFQWRLWVVLSFSVLSIGILSMEATWILLGLPWLVSGLGVVACAFGLSLALRALTEGSWSAVLPIVTLSVLSITILLDGISSDGKVEAWLSVPYGFALTLTSFAVLFWIDESKQRLKASREADLAQQKLMDLDSIHRFGTGINSVLDLETFLKEVIQETAHQLSVRRCSLILVDDKGELSLKTAVGLPVEAEGQKLPLEQGVAGWVFSHGEPLTPGRLLRQQDGFPELAPTRYLTGSFISWPLRRAERIIGVLNVSDKNDGSPLTTDDELLIESLANRLVQVVDNALYYNQLKKENEQLKKELFEPCEPVKSFSEPCANQKALGDSGEGERSFCQVSPLEGKVTTSSIVGK